MYGRSLPPSNSFGPMLGNCRTRSSSAAWTVAPATLTSVCPPVCSRNGDGISTLTGILVSKPDSPQRTQRTQREINSRIPGRPSFVIFESFVVKLLNGNWLAAGEEGFELAQGRL